MLLTRKFIFAGCLAATVTSGLARAEDPPKPAEPPKPSYTLSANVFLVSDYFFRGITQTWGKPAIQGGFDFVHDSGIYRRHLGVERQREPVCRRFHGMGLLRRLQLQDQRRHDRRRGRVSSTTIRARTSIRPRRRAPTRPSTPSKAIVSFNWKWVGVKVSLCLHRLFRCQREDRLSGDTSGTYYPELNVDYPLMDNFTLVGTRGVHALQIRLGRSQRQWARPIRATRTGNSA